MKHESTEDRSRTRPESALKGVRSAVSERLRRARIASDPFPFRSYTNRHEAIFVHIPRCGGTSLLQALAGRTRPRDHCAFQIYRQADPDRFARYFKFAFVRDPLTRLHSAYRYLVAGGNGDGDLRLAESIRSQCQNFDAFAQNWLSERHLISISLFRPQAFFVYDGVADEFGVDFLGRFENYAEDAAAVLERLGLDPHSLPSLNASRNAAHSASDLDLEAETRERVRALYALDYQVLGYDAAQTES